MNKQPISTSYIDGKPVGQDYFRDPQVQANTEGAGVVLKNLITTARMSTANDEQLDMVILILKDAIRRLELYAGK